MQVGKSWEKAKEAHLKAAEAYANCGSLYHAGKQLEQAINMVRDLGQLDQVELLAERGGLLYRQAGSPESAAQLMVRAAKLLEMKEPGKAVGLYKKVRERLGRGGQLTDRTYSGGRHCGHGGQTD